MHWYMSNWPSKPNYLILKTVGGVRGTLYAIFCQNDWVQLTAGNCMNHKKSNPLAHFWCMCNWPPKKIENCWRSYPYNSDTLFANYHTALTRGIQFACTYLDRRHPKNKHAIYRVFILKTEFYSTAKHYAINIAHIKQKLPHKMPCILLIASNLVEKKIYWLWKTSSIKSFIYM